MKTQSTTRSCRSRGLNPKIRSGLLLSETGCRTTKRRWRETARMSSTGYRLPFWARIVNQVMLADCHRGSRWSMASLQRKRRRSCLRPVARRRIVDSPFWREHRAHGTSYSASLESTSIQLRSIAQHSKISTTQLPKLSCRSTPWKHGCKLRSTKQTRRRTARNCRLLGHLGAWSVASWTILKLRSSRSHSRCSTSQ